MWDAIANMAHRLDTLEQRWLDTDRQARANAHCIASMKRTADKQAAEVDSLRQWIRIGLIAILAASNIGADRAAELLLKIIK